MNTITTSQENTNNEYYHEIKTLHEAIDKVNKQIHITSEWKCRNDIEIATNELILIQRENAIAKQKAITDEIEAQITSVEQWTRKNHSGMYHNKVNNASNKADVSRQNASETEQKVTLANKVRNNAEQQVMNAICQAIDINQQAIIAMGAIITKQALVIAKYETTFTEQNAVNIKRAKNDTNQQVNINYSEQQTTERQITDPIQSNIDDVQQIIANINRLAIVIKKAELDVKKIKSDAMLAKLDARLADQSACQCRNRCQQDDNDPENLYHQKTQINDNERSARRIELNRLESIVWGANSRSNYIDAILFAAEQHVIKTNNQIKDVNNQAIVATAAVTIRAINTTIIAQNDINDIKYEISILKQHVVMAQHAINVIQHHIETNHG